MGGNWATENFAARAANLAWECLATNHSGGKRQTDRKTMRQMSEGRETERERMTKSGVEFVLTRGRGGYRSGISHARLHLHILLRIVARLAANRKMRHRQTNRRRSTDRER